MIFDFKCGACNTVKADVVLPFNHAAEDHPGCCGEPMKKHFTSFPMVTWTDGDLPDGAFKPDRSGTVISTRKERREYMARHDLVDANELGPPPTNEEQRATVEELEKSVAAITPNAQQEYELQQSGILEELGE